jgi:nucleoside-diphosphate-sugar epimerase
LFYTNHAINNGKIRVFGGNQRRPNIHIDDMTDLYLHTLNLPSNRIDGGIFNAGYENHQIIEIAEMVRSIVGSSVDIAVEASDDLRSYHISSDLIATALDFRPKKTIPDAVRSLTNAFEKGLVPESMSADKYYNIKTMQLAGLK